jgi:hypothetical protein
VIESAIASVMVCVVRFGCTYVVQPYVGSDKLNRIDVGIAGQEIAEGLTFASLLAF